MCNHVQRSKNCIFELKYWVFSEAEEGNSGKWNISVPGRIEIERDSVSSGERRRNSLNLPHRQGLQGQTLWQEKSEERSGMGGQRRWKPRIWSLSTVLVWYLSTAIHVKCRGNLGRPSSKAKYFSRPIVNKYREGKVKNTPSRGMK